MIVFGSLFTGGALADLGARAAGLEPAWGIELEPRIAEVATHNLGHKVIASDVLEVDPRRCAPINALHASPPCPNYSAAKPGGKETALDIALAKKIGEFVSVLEPRVFTLENVPAYRNGKGWAQLEHTLWSLGYWLHVAILNAADYGVPQTRRRMIVRAVRGDLVPALPDKQPWRGWYGAIADLVPTLPESEFAPWQLERLPEKLATMLVSGGGHYTKQGSSHVATFAHDEPAMTVLTGSVGRARAFVEGSFLHMTGASSTHPETRGTGVLEPERPANTVTPSSLKSRAFIVHPTDQRSMPVRDGGEPAFTCMAGIGDSLNMPRAYLVDQGNSHGTTREPTVRGDIDPAFTITGSQNRTSHRALFEGGRIVKMTPRALARFQGIPDSYELPEHKSLACRIIGNACCPPLFERLYGGFA